MKGTATVQTGERGEAQALVPAFAAQHDDRQSDGT